MPYPNEHACRIRDPNEFQKDSFRRIRQGKLHIIIGKLKGKSATTTQAFRYPIDDWTANEAQDHCKRNEGTFERAKVMNEKKGFDSPMVTRAVSDEAEIRSINEESRQATFVAATENGVMTSTGREYLKMSGARLARYRKNPVVVDTHNIREARSVIGRAEIKIEDKKLISTVTFAETTHAEEIWKLVKGRFLRALSIGFIPNRNRTLVLNVGQTDGEDDGIIEGPARIVREWELCEISIVPVPTDADAIARAIFNTDNLASIRTSINQILTDFESDTKGVSQMAEETTTDRDMEIEDAPPGAETRLLQNRQVINATIRSQTPKSLGDLGIRIADELIAANASVDDACKRFLKELQEKTKSVGSTEPEQPTKNVTQQVKAANLKDLTDQQFMRALGCD